MAFVRLCFFGVAAICSLTAWAEEAAPSKNENVSYWKTIRPIFQQHCQGCHQPAKAGGGLVITSVSEPTKGGESETPGVVPGKPDETRSSNRSRRQVANHLPCPRGSPPWRPVTSS